MVLKAVVSAVDPMDLREQLDAEIRPHLKLLSLNSLEYADSQNLCARDEYEEGQQARLQQGLFWPSIAET